MCVGVYKRGDNSGQENRKCNSFFVIVLFQLTKQRKQQRNLLIFQKTAMDKYTWRQVKSLSSSSHKPSSRWGHSCCVVGEDIVFFGGYADSNYMNDLWAFNSVTMKWREIQTTGDVPIQRSNCTMNYDKNNNQIVVFGGGGSNKQRFNSISVLDWETKHWVQINPKQNQQAPWERTYHVAELIFPYLIVFGGEGVADIDDLWVFNFNTLGWTEVKIPNDSVKPCARRFHSSVRIGNQFIVLAGCHGKYRCLSDIFSMDMSPLIQTGSVQQLQWKQRKLKNSSFLTRWGHSSCVYDNKIYVFGGRFSNDLNDLLVADFQTNTIKSLKISQQAPAARRRHCAGFIGSSMVIFGGFNGQYFNDLHYISVQDSKPRYEISTIFDQKQLLELINNKQYGDYCIRTTTTTTTTKQVKQELFYINIAMLTKYFTSQSQLMHFLHNIQCSYSLAQLTQIFTILYTGYGYGDISVTTLPLQIKSQLQYPIFDSKSERLSYEKQAIQKCSSVEEWEGRPVAKKSMQAISHVVKLGEDVFTEYIIQAQHKDAFDADLTINQWKYPINKLKLIAKSPYFKNLFSSLFSRDKYTLIDILQSDSRVVYQIFFNFLQTDFLVVPDNVSSETYLELMTLADYYFVPVLGHLCCNQLINMITAENVQCVLVRSIELKINNLSKACCDFWIKKVTETVKLSEVKAEIRRTFGSQNKVSKLLESSLSKVSFDLSQIILESEKNIPNFSKKNISYNSNVQKQNFESNLYSH